MLYRELGPVLWVQHSGTATRLQESRAEAGVVAGPRTEARRTTVRDDCAEGPGGWLCGTAVQSGPEDGCADRGAQRTAVQTEGPIGWLCRQRGPEAETSLLHADLL